MNTIGERIKSLRTKKKLSAQELGDIIGRTKSNISGYENGKYEPSAQTIISLCQYFGVSTDWLLTGTEQQAKDLSELESDLIAMFRILNKQGKEDIFDYLKLKYEKLTGQRGSVYLTYTDTNNPPSDPENSKNSNHQTA